MTKEQILATSLYEQLAQEREQHQQQLSAERERAGKLVELLQECLEYHLDATCDKFIIERIKQTLNEYDTATKES